MEERRRADDMNYTKLLEKFSSLDSKFNELNSKLDIFIATQTTLCANHSRDIENLMERANYNTHAIDGFNDQKGLKARLTRLEEVDTNHAKNYFVIYSGLITLALGAIWEMIKRK